MFRLVVALSCALLIASTSEAKIFSTTCSLARALFKNGLPRHQLPDWVCLVQSESSGDTSVIGRQNSDGSLDYGLYQINDRYWCKLGNRGGGCNIDCNRLLDDNIAAATKCALIIYSQMGFSAWEGWKKKCQGALPDLSGCGLHDL